MKITSKDDVGNNSENRIIYTVEVVENKFIDVMHVDGQQKLIYVMELPDGKTVYDANGNSLDYKIDEKAAIDFVRAFIEKNIKTEAIYEQIESNG